MPAESNYSYAQAFDRRPGGHHGTDIFAPRGTPVLAVFDGDARAEEDPKGGTVVYLTGTGAFPRTAYYAHLDSVEPPLGTGASLFVQAGAVIGYVGNTGNAAGKAPHLHLQVSNPNGRSVADPFPHLVEVDTKRGGRPVDPSKPPEPPAVDVDETTGAITLDDDLLLVGGGLVVVLALWWLFSSNSSERRRAA
jgi:murein DD-endopeptidase MepM/ murein hydrolase activator NlpD